MTRKLVGTYRGAVPDTYIISDPDDTPYILDRGVANGRGFHVEVRPGFTEGEYLGLALRMWGPGHWCIRDGQPSYFTDRVEARQRGMRWIETGDAPDGCGIEGE